MSDYQKIKDQISFAITGKQDIKCANCGKPATAKTGRIIEIRHVKSRIVSTTCRHCHVSYSFVWA
jgi:RNase P subunit RPR2